MKQFGIRNYDTNMTLKISADIDDTTKEELRPALPKDALVFVNAFGYSGHSRYLSYLDSTLSNDKLKSHIFDLNETDLSFEKLTKMLTDKPLTSVSALSAAFPDYEFQTIQVSIKKDHLELKPDVAPVTDSIDFVMYKKDTNFNVYQFIDQLNDYYNDRVLEIEAWTPMDKNNPLGDQDFEDQICLLFECDQNEWLNLDQTNEIEFNKTDFLKYAIEHNQSNIKLDPDPDNWEVVHEVHQTLTMFVAEK